jgi:glycine cleavage system H lipoate-binding protein
VIEANPLLADSRRRSIPTRWAGWFFKMKLADPAELDKLMDRPPTNAFVEPSA